jgi:WD40 repeat protein
MSPPTLFFSYSSQDSHLRRKIDKHLSLLKIQSIISSWHDGLIMPGEEWDAAIKSQLRSADIILLLISDDFLASDYITRIEMPEAMARHERGEALVIPIILRPVAWESAPFAKLNALPRRGKAVTEWKNRDSAYKDIARGIELAARAFKKRPVPVSPAPDEAIDFDLPITIRRIRKHEKIDAQVIANVAFHPSGELMAYSLDHRLFLFPLNDEFAERLGVHTAPSRTESPRPSEGSQATVQPAPNQNEITMIDLDEAHFSRITDISFSPNGRLVASSDANGTIKFWSLDTRQCVAETSEHSDAITNIAFSPEGKLFASGGYDEFINIWKVDHLLNEYHPSPYRILEKRSKIKRPARFPHDIEQIMSLAFSHNGKHLASGDQQGVVVVREIESKETVFRDKIHNGRVVSMAFSPVDHSLLATASWDKRIRLTNFRSIEKKKTETLGVGDAKHSASVVSIAFSSGGDVIVSSGTDRLVKLWHVRSRKLLRSDRTEDDRPVEKVAFFPNKYDFATDTYSSDISLWDITNEGAVTNTLIGFE